jgi:hypothetical protein
VTALIRSYSDRELREAEGGRDIVCLALTYHAAAPGPLPPWRLWLQSFSFLSLGCDVRRGALRCALQEFATDAAGCAGDERRLLESLAAAWAAWVRPLVVTLQGDAILIPALRVRSLLLNVALPGVHPDPGAPAAGARRRMRTAHLDLIEELQLPRMRPALPLPRLFDDFGLAFSKTFERWRHDPAAAAQMMAATTLLLFLRRAAHDGTIDRAAAAALLDAFRDRAAGLRGEAPWLDAITRGFAA